MQSERRQSTRLTCTGTVDFNTSESLSDDAQSSMPALEGRVVDLSENGFSMVTPTDLSASKILKVRIPVPGTAVKIPTLAMKVWQVSADGAFKAGFRFIV